jgi:hypothetical protein
MTTDKAVDVWLIAFLSARLDEDELAARNAGGETWDFTGPDCKVRVREPDGDLGRIIAYCRHGEPLNEDLALAIHIGHNDPARTLREIEIEIEIRRARLRRYLEQPSWHLPEGVRDTDERQRAQIVKDVLDGEVREDAAVYSDHPDYRQEWKP